MFKAQKALIVDDDPDFSQLLKCALEDDFMIFTATDGREGVKNARRILPDIILMDVMMPNVAGIEMARMLLAEEETKNIPIIVLTASQFDMGVATLFTQERNVRQFLSKTTPLVQILSTVKSVLSNTNWNNG